MAQKTTTLNELVRKLLELQKVLPGDVPVVADSAENDDQHAPLHFDAVLDVFHTHITKSDEEPGQFKEVIMMATGTTAGGDIIPAVRHRLNKKRG